MCCCPFLFFLSFFILFYFILFIFYFFLIITEHTSIFNSAPLMIIFVGLKMQVGHIHIVL